MGGYRAGPEEFVQVGGEFVVVGRDVAASEEAVVGEPEFGGGRDVCVGARTQAKVEGLDRAVDRGSWVPALSASLAIRAQETSASRPSRTRQMAGSRSWTSVSRCRWVLTKCSPSDSRITAIGVGRSVKPTRSAPRRSATPSMS